MTATTRSFDPTAFENTLFVSFELGEGRWTLSFTSGFGEQLLRRSVRGRDRKAVLCTIEAMKERLGLAPDARVASCYEAGRDGFWLHRALLEHGIENIVVADNVPHPGKRQMRLDLEPVLRLLADLFLEREETAEIGVGFVGCDGAKRENASLAVPGGNLFFGQ